MEREWHVHFVKLCWKSSGNVDKTSYEKKKITRKIFTKAYVKLGLVIFGPRIFGVVGPRKTSCIMRNNVRTTEHCRLQPRN